MTFDPYNMAGFVKIITSPAVSVPVGIVLAAYCLSRLMLLFIKSISIEETDTYEAYRDDE